MDGGIDLGEVPAHGVAPGAQEAEEPAAVRPVHDRLEIADAIVYLLSPREKAPSLDRFFANLPPPSSPDPQLLGDFFVTGDTTLASLAEIYGIAVDPSQQALTVDRLRRVVGGAEGESA